MKKLIGLGGGFGVSGISGKYYTGSTALQGMVGAYRGEGLGVGLDYLLEMPDIAAAGPVNIAWNLGVGRTVRVNDNLGVGVSGVAGLEFNFVPVPIDLVLEYRPGLHVIPDIDLDLVNFSGHLRFYFR